MKIIKLKFELLHTNGQSLYVLLDKQKRKVLLSPAEVTSAIAKQAVGMLRNGFRQCWRSRKNIFMHKLSSVSSLCDSSKGYNPETVTIPYAKLSNLGEELMRPFNNFETLATAMVHKSVINDSIVFAEVRPGVLTRLTANNEKLELLGDKVFGLLATNFLYLNNKGLSEGEISQIVHSLVSRKNADFYCRQLNLHRFLVKSKSVYDRKGYSLPGDFFEALLGAVFVDGGYSAAENFFNARVTTLFKSQHTRTKKFVSIDQKGNLQEHLVASGLPSTRLGTVLQYVTVSSSQGPGVQSYTQAIVLFGHRLSVGTGSTKTAADQNAAKRLLSSLQKSGGTTCVIIRLAREASDEETLSKAQTVRKNREEGRCTS